ncbi:hypothetical protein Lalb_Chr06g0167301 [Lupinus albus]|uniref:Uncharacterized protein n=1 Tax=Lupinus albus TaxID=3870 RepID=A0A6A4QED5_LUPAL|nr:hypothetical protein Lalb_Chr06g0167301 [Lupinus albus]
MANYVFAKVACNTSNLAYVSFVSLLMHASIAGVSSLGSFLGLLAHICLDMSHACACVCGCVLACWLILVSVCPMPSALACICLCLSPADPANSCSLGPAQSHVKCLVATCLIPYTNLT